MIYKNKKLIQDITNFNKSLISKFEKKIKSIWISGSYKKLFLDYVTDIDFQIIPKKKYFKEIFPEIIQFLLDKKTIIQKLSIKKLSTNYFTKNNIPVANLNIEENILMYRKWKSEEIVNGIKIDSMGNMINLADILEYHIFNHQTHVTLDFLYKFNHNIYIPISFSFKLKSKKILEEAILADTDKYYDLGHLQKTYARLCSLSHIILREYNITDADSIYLMTEINKYEKLSYNSNLLGSIKIQMELVGEVENNQPNLKMIINGLYNIVKSKKLIRRLYFLKKDNSQSYYHKFNELNKIIDIIMIQNSNFIKPDVDKLFAKIKHLYKSNMVRKLKTKKKKNPINPHNSKKKMNTLKNSTQLLKKKNINLKSKSKIIKKKVR